MKGKLWFIALLLILFLVISSFYMVSAQPYKIRKLGESYIQKAPSKYRYKLSTNTICSIFSYMTNK